MVVALATVATTGISLAADLSPASATTPPVKYYVAMGDSMAAGTGASTTANRYVNVIYQHELAQYPGLQLVNLACGGATVGSVINGPGCSYTTGTQLGDAEAFLAAHPKQIAFVTIDIGANNVDGCLGSSGIDIPCVQTGLGQITTLLPQILSGLRGGYPGLAIYGMSYYDPFLNQWLTGASGQAVAEQSVTYAVALNGILAQIFGAAGASTADPATLFDTTDFALTGTYQGTVVPQNVALICAWTLMCSQNNIHPNDLGHAVVAQAFEAVIDQVAVVTTALLSGSVRQQYSVHLAADGGLAPYKWSLSSGTLPTGLHLTAVGVVTGRPSASGSSTFTVKVVDHRTVTHAQQTATQTLSLTITQPTPVITLVHLNTGPVTGGTKVTITGISLWAPSSVMFGVYPATAVTVNAAGTKITAYSPAEGTGTVDIVVTTPGGISTSGASDKFTYS